MQTQYVGATASRLENTDPLRLDHEAGFVLLETLAAGPGIICAMVGAVQFRPAAPRGFRSRAEPRGACIVMPKTAERENSKQRG